MLRGKKKLIGKMKKNSSELVKPRVQVMSALIRYGHTLLLTLYVKTLAMCNYSSSLPESYNNITISYRD